MTVNMGAISRWQPCSSNKSLYINICVTIYNCTDLPCRYCSHAYTMLSSTLRLDGRRSWTLGEDGSLLAPQFCETRGWELSFRIFWFSCQQRILFSVIEWLSKDGWFVLLSVRRSEALHRWFSTFWPRGPVRLQNKCCGPMNFQKSTLTQNLIKIEVCNSNVILETSFFAVFLIFAIYTGCHWSFCKAKITKSCWWSLTTNLTVRYRLKGRRPCCLL